MDKFIEFVQDNVLGLWVGFSVLLLLLGIVIDVPRIIVAGSVSLIISGITILKGWGAVGKVFADALKGKYSPELAVFLWGVLIAGIGATLYVLEIDYDLDISDGLNQFLLGKPIETVLMGFGGAIAIVGTMFVGVWKRILS